MQVQVHAVPAAGSDRSLQPPYPGTVPVHMIKTTDYKIEMFKPLIKKYNWQLSEVLDNFYNNRSKELCFNGTLARK